MATARVFLQNLYEGVNPLLMYSLYTYSIISGLAPSSSEGEEIFMNYVQDNSFEKRKQEREQELEEKRKKFEALPSGQKAIIIATNEASRNAKERENKLNNVLDRLQSGGFTSEDKELILNLLSKMSGGDEYGIYKKKKRTDGVKFVQLIQDNWDYALENKLITDEEVLFLMRIQRRLAFKTNCIVFDIHAKTKVPMTQKDIADFLKTDKAKISRIIKSLTEKGIMVRAIGHKKEGVNARTYSLYVNPHLMISGEKDKIEETLKMLFINAKEKTKDFPIQLF